MRHSYRILLWVAGTAAFAAPARPVFALGNGPLTAKVSGSAETRYDDNVFLTPSAQKQGDRIMIGRGGLDLGLAGENGGFGLDYGVESLTYHRFHEANNSVNQSARGGGNWKFGEGGRLSLTEKFLTTTDPANSELTKRLRRHENNVSGGLDLPLGGKTYLGLLGDDTKTNYKKNNEIATLLDRSEWTAGARLGWLATEKTKVFLEYLHGATKYDVDVSTYKNNKTDSYAAGVSGQWTEKTKGELVAGSMTRSYDTDLVGVKNKVTTPFLNAAVKWAAGEKTFVSVEASRRFEESTINRYYTSTTGGLSITQGIGDHLEARIYGSGGTDQYPDAITIGAKTAKRTDTLSQAGADLKFTFLKVVWLRVGCLYRARSSNFDVFNYANNLSSAELGLTF